MIRKSLTMLACTLVFLAGCGVATGEKAVMKMNPEEKAYMSEILMKIKPDTPESELVKILGAPNRDAGTARPVWLGPGNDEKSQVAFYYNEGKLFKIRWMKLGVFIWERDFK